VSNSYILLHSKTKFEREAVCASILAVTHLLKLEKLKNSKQNSSIP